MAFLLLQNFLSSKAHVCIIICVFLQINRPNPLFLISLEMSGRKSYLLRPNGWTDRPYLQMIIDSSYNNNFLLIFFFFQERCSLPTPLSPLQHPVYVRPVCCYQRFADRPSSTPPPPNPKPFNNRKENRTTNTQ